MPRSKDAGIGNMGQDYLACGESIALRRWEECAGKQCQSPGRDYETVGYVISGELEIEVDGDTATVCAGESWLMPKGSPHQYRVVEDIVAVEATSPPARADGRDE